jgi:hypothetical protein
LVVLLEAVLGRCWAVALEGVSEAASGSESVQVLAQSSEVVWVVALVQARLGLALVLLLEAVLAGSLEAVQLVAPLDAE